MNFENGGQLGKLQQLTDEIAGSSQLDRPLAGLRRQGNKHEIAARGEISSAGLFSGNNECPAKQSDYDCVQAELMSANQLLLTDTASGVRYHVRVE